MKKQILVVEDEGLIAADVQRRLERMGYSVPAIAQSGEEAIGCARVTPFDLVLMDIRIQGDMDGIATAAALKAEFETPVVYMTAHSDQDTVNRAKLTEPYGYVVKPVGDGNLRSAVQIALYKGEMERRLRTSEAWLAATLRSVGEGVVATDTNGGIVFLNPVAEQFVGWRAADAQGRQLMEVLELLDETSRLPAKNPVFDLFPGESRGYTLISKTGACLAVEIECFENRSAEEVLGAIVTVRDIRTRQELERRMVQTQRMEAVSSMAGELAHEFNNHITVILGYAEDLAERLSGEELEDAVEIRQAASVAASISSQLLTLSRRDTVRTEVYNIHDAILEIQPMLSHALGKTNHLTTDLGSPVGYVRGDRNRMKQVLLNLTLNARDAMSSGGELRIESRVVEIDADRPEGRQYRPGPYVRLRLTDSGEGMDQATLARIFEPFFTTKTAGRGSGLGLSIVHSIVVQSGGYITASSEKGNGTTFEILLPCIGTFLGIGQVTDSHGAGGDAVPTILLVDDDDGVRKLAHSYLESEGFQLLEARNAEEAELIAEVYPEPIHVLVSDVQMPGMSGPRLAERLAALRPHMKVLFITGHHSGRQGLEGNVLPKPFPASELLRRVRQLLVQVTV
jgi:PAS domain S-box-containing protein